MFTVQGVSCSTCDHFEMLDSLLFWTYFRRLTLRRTHIIDFRLTTSFFWKKKNHLLMTYNVNFIMHVGIFHFSSLASLMFPLTFFTEKSATKIMMRSNSNNSITGCSLSEWTILLSIKPKYDDRFCLRFTQIYVNLSS